MALGIGSANWLSAYNDESAITVSSNSRPLSPKTHLDHMCNAKPVNKTSLLTGVLTEPQSQSKRILFQWQPIISSNYSDYTSLLL